MYPNICNMSGFYVTITIPKILCPGFGILDHRQAQTESTYDQAKRAPH